MLQLMEYTPKSGFDQYTSWLRGGAAWAATTVPVTVHLQGAQGSTLTFNLYGTKHTLIASQYVNVEWGFNKKAGV